MTKAEIIEAINSTIVANGQKGITAESLSLILTEIVNMSGEGGSGGGSGDGALRVIVPEIFFLGNMIAEAGEISPSSWPDIKSSLESTFGADLSEYDAVVNASFAHNANVAQQILEKAKTGNGVSVVLDQTPYSQAYFSLMRQMEPEMASAVESFAISGVQPAGLMLQYFKSTSEGESILGMGEMLECVLLPADHGEGLFPTYPSTIAIALNLDGSLIFEMADTYTNTESGS